jgi:glycosyltransferase involved in cell wall biosynthesis
VTGMAGPSAALDVTTGTRTPAASVIVPTWNEAKYLPALLDSLRHQTRPPLEILVADSGSTDGTQEAAEARGALVLEGERRGPGEGRNRGAHAARGDPFVFVDADCVAPPDLLETIDAAMDEPGVIGGATGFMPAHGNIMERALFFLANGYQRAMTLWGYPHNAGYCFFFRREAFQDLGGLREDMLLNETHDLALRSRSLGRFVILPRTVQTSMRRFRTYGYARTIVKEYIASTILYYATGRTSEERFRPAPAR